MSERRMSGDARLSEAELLSATGIPKRKLTRWRQQGLVPVLEQRHGLGPGGGTTPLEYPLIAIATINRLNELSHTMKDIDERRWRLWLEGYPVRIAPDLSDMLRELNSFRSEIKTLNAYGFGSSNSGSRMPRIKQKHSVVSEHRSSSLRPRKIVRIGSPRGTLAGLQ